MPPHQEIFTSSTISQLCCHYTSKLSGLECLMILDQILNAKHCKAFFEEDTTCRKARTCSRKKAQELNLLQFMHIPDRDRCNWLRERIETQVEVKFFSP